jgi:CheY-like chemotaxis protein
VIKTMQHILLAAEEPFTRTALSFLLGTTGYTVSIVEDEERLLNLISSFGHTTRPFDLLVLSPRYSTEPLVSKISELRSKGNCLPVLLIQSGSGQFSPPLSDWCDSIRLPFEADDFFGSITKLLRSEDQVLDPYFKLPLSPTPLQHSA